jgi:NADH:ubiquinone oxidoreductase subunit 5 (subunit L)/multisubunit Na+/H+ antiporter MnhA subunit
LGLGTIGLGKLNHALVLLGFGGALLHILNHSLFKSLLFYTAGSVYKATHTRNMDQLGGLVHTMPQTTAFFFAGSLAICALPPLNGFISEVLIYYGLFAGLQLNSFYLTLLMTLAILSLSLVGGLAIFGFTRSLGVTFLGSPRQGITVKDERILENMLFPKYLIVFVIVAIGLAPSVFIAPLMEITGVLFNVKEPEVIQLLLHALAKISLISMILILLVIALWYLRKVLHIKEKTTIGPTWGCGYTAGTPRQQYTASSFAANFTELANPLLRSKDDFHSIPAEELFPAARKFHRRTSDSITNLVNRVTGLAQDALRNIARLQTGHIQHYILYAFLFMFFIFGLLFLNLI